MRSNLKPVHVGLNRVRVVQCGLFALLGFATNDPSAAIPPSMADSLPPAVLRYGPPRSPLSWNHLENLVDLDSFVVPAAVVGIDSPPVSVRRIEFHDARPYGEKSERDAYLVRYATVPYGPPEGVPFNVVFDAETEAVVCAFTDAADSWAQPGISPMGIQAADQTEIWGENPFPARYGELRSTVMQVLDAFVRANHPDLGKVGQVILRPRYFLNTWPKRDLHGESVHAPGNMWIVEQLGTPVGQDYGIFLTSLVALFFDADRSWKQTGLGMN